MHVLVIGADERTARERARQLQMDGHDTEVASAPQQARIMLARGPDAVVLASIGSAPETIGLLRDLRAGVITRADGNVPVVIAGADGDSDLVRYYRAGADIALPGNVASLLLAACLEALARRLTTGRRRVVTIGSLRLDLDARAAEVDGRQVRLTRIEFDLLQTLAGQPHKTFTRAELTREVWGYDPDAAGPSRTIDSHAHRLRRKLTQAGCEPVMHTLRGVGWRLAR